MPIDEGNGFGSVMYFNGAPIGPVSGIETITMAVTEDDTTAFSIPRSFSMTMRWKSGKMARERFCRELMKLGFTKKEAKAAARSIRGNYARNLIVAKFCGKERYMELIKGNKPK